MATQVYQEVLAQEPTQSEALYLLGLLAHQSGDLDIAIQYYRRSLASQPAAETHNNLGAALQQKGQLEAAIGHYQVALRLQPGHASANVNLGTTLLAQGNRAAAMVRFQRALQLNPALPQAHTNLAHLLKQQGREAEAIDHYRRALHLWPDNPETYKHLGDALQEAGCMDEALALYDQGLQRHPSHSTLQGSRLRTLLISGNLLQGFAEYDPWRLAQQERSFSQPAWDGSDLMGRSILLYSETGAGFGDTLQMIRYAPLVAERGGRVIVECQSSLVRLFQELEGIDTVVARGDRLPEFQVQSSLLSLPLVFGTTLATIPASVPYIRVSIATNQIAVCLPESGFKVGLVWGGDPDHLHDQDRSCPLVELLPCLQIPGITWISLQKGSHCSELSQIPPDLVQDWSPYLTDFGETAAAIASLDLVLTVDTAVAHLAGAMGKPTWLLLAYAADWRWLMERSDSPWYPSLTLFRQSRRNDWSELCERVARALGTLAGG